VADVDIIFLPCGFFYFSSPNLRGRIVDVYHTSTLAAEIGSVVWGTSANFNGFGVLASLLQRRRSPEANQTLRR